MSINIESFKQHNLQYEEDIAFKREQEIHKLKTIGAYEKNGGNWDNLYKPGHIHGDWLDNNIFIRCGVDIGCGTGWFVNHLYNKYNFSNIYGIEPSFSAIKIAKQINNNKNINYLVGFAEEQLLNIKLNEPTLFTTFIVLSHLPDESVKKILKEMDNIAPKNSVFIFNENVGTEFHMNLWNCRTKKWWEENLSNWTITYDKRPRPELRNYKQGLMGIKK